MKRADGCCGNCQWFNKADRMCTLHKWYCHAKDKPCNNYHNKEFESCRCRGGRLQEV